VAHLSAPEAALSPDLLHLVLASPYACSDRKKDRERERERERRGGRQGGKRGSLSYDSAIWESSLALRRDADADAGRSRDYPLAGFPLRVESFAEEYDCLESSQLAPLAILPPPHPVSLPYRDGIAVSPSPLHNFGLTNEPPSRNSPRRGYGNRAIRVARLAEAHPGNSSSPALWRSVDVDVTDRIRRRACAIFSLR